VIELARKMPVQKPGRSKQDYATPRVFLDAVEKRFGRLEFDLAATAANRVATRYFGPGARDGEDALKRDWPKLGRLWLNPPFGHIEPWADRCARWKSKGGRIFFLVPASVGSNWYARHVYDKARVIFLNGRLSFDGKDPYPKDLILACYGERPGYEVWRWNEREKR
jgi:phage N-6-adenine-methyltransferase